MTLKCPKGIGLLELVLALAVTTTIILLATRYFQTTRASQKVTLAANMYRDVFKATQQYYQQTAPSGAIDSGVLVNAGLLSIQFRSNPWGGAITIAPLQMTQGPYPGFYGLITMTEIPSASCTLLAKQLTATLTVSETVTTRSCGTGKLTVSYELY